MSLCKKPGCLYIRRYKGQHPGVLGEEERASVGGQVFAPGVFDPPVVVIQRLEDGEKRFGPLRIEAEIVDSVVRTSPGKLALLVDELDHLHDPAQIDHITARQLAQPD